MSLADKSIIGRLKVGDDIFVNDGLLKFRVEETRPDALVCRCIAGGVMSDNKGMNFPNRIMHTTYLSDRDKADLAFGAETESISSRRPSSLRRRTCSPCASILTPWAVRT